MSTQDLSLTISGESGAAPDATADALFENVAQEYAAPLARLARAHEADPALQQDLLQEIHLALWRSFPAFQNRCSLRTWVYRVAHNVAATHVVRAKRRRTRQLVSLDDVEIADQSTDPGAFIDEARALVRVSQLIQRLKPIDREVIILHLEGLSRDEIAEIAGLSFSNVAIKIHRIKLLLTRAFGGAPGVPEKS